MTFAQMAMIVAAGAAAMPVQVAALRLWRNGRLANGYVLRSRGITLRELRLEEHRC